MAFGEESPSEKEDRLQRREERLERQHERVKEMRSLPEKGGGGPNMGANSKIGQYISEHRWEFVIGIIATVIVGYIFFRAQSGNAGTSTSSGSTGSTQGASSANNQGDLGAAGYTPSGVAYGLTQLGVQMTDLQTQLGLLGTPGTTTNTTNITNSQVPLKWSLPPVFAAGTKVTTLSSGEVDALTPGGTKYMLLGPKSNPGAGLLPQGTKIEQGGQGRFWYVEPGQYEQALVPTAGYTGNVLGVTKLNSGIYQINTPQNPGTPNA